MTPFKRWMLFVLVFPLLYVAGVIAYELNREQFPRLDLPAFDAAKAAQLTPEKRAAYEQELFSELQQWNRGSRKYPTLADIGRREQRWQAMADDGLELAHITLSVLKPEGGFVYRLVGPMKRLEELAKAGDVGAMCLMPGLVNVIADQIDWTAYRPTYERWMQRGVELKHPECMKSKGSQFLRGVSGVERDAQRGLELQFAARRAGYAHDVGSLILHYQDKGYSNPNNVRRLYCWRQIEGQFRFGDMEEIVLQKLDIEARRTQRSDLQALYEELKKSKFGLQDCVNLGQGD